jgi:homoserine dehydrogenase
MSSSQLIRVGLLGFGTVGKAVHQSLEENRDLIEARCGRTPVIAQIAVNDLSKDRGASVVTANKELVAKKLSRLTELAMARKADLRFEAAVGAGIPIIQPLMHELGGCRIKKMKGILNGTTNHILTEMRTRGVPFDEALEEAQMLGYAEADPTSDVDGFDALYKIIIAASLTSGTQIELDASPCSGIRDISLADINHEEGLGRRLKLIAEADLTGDAPSVTVGVQSLLHSHPLSQIEGTENALWIEADPLGEVTLSGPGAGGGATASAVLGDLVEVVRTIDQGCVSPPWPIAPSF